MFCDMANRQDEAVNGTCRCTIFVPFSARGVGDHAARRQTVSKDRFPSISTLPCPSTKRILK